MDLTCPQAELLAATTALSRVLRREAQPSFASLLHLTTEGDRLRVTGATPELSLTRWVSATIAAPGAAVVAGRLFHDYLATLPAAPLTLRQTADDLQVRSAAWSSRFPTQPVGDYPLAPEAVEGSLLPLPLDLVAFAEGLPRLAWSASRDPLRPALTGLHLTLGPDRRLELATADTIRLTHQVTELLVARPADLPDELLLPLRPLDEARRHLLEVPGQSRLDYHPSRHRVIFSGPYWRLTLGCLNAPFPAYRTILPAGFRGAVELDLVAFRQAVRSIRTVGGPGGIWLLWPAPDAAEPQLGLTNANRELGAAEAGVRVQAQSGPPPVATRRGPALALNGAALGEALDWGATTIRLSYPEGPGPVAFTWPEWPGFTHYLIPLNPEVVG